MHSAFDAQPTTPVIPISFATRSTWPAIAATLPATAKAFAAAHGFNGKPGAWLALPNADGANAQVLFGALQLGTPNILELDHIVIPEGARLP